MRGRKPKPTALKALAGNPGKRKPNRREPKPRASLPSCPSHLGKIARQEWGRLSSELHGIGLLTEIDRGALAELCATWELLVTAEEHLRKEGPVIRVYEKDAEGHVYLVGTRRNPWAIIWKQANGAYWKGCTEFGLTPSSRTRVSATESEEEEDPFKKFDVIQGGKK